MVFIFIYLYDMKSNRIWILTLVVLAWIIIFHTTGIKPAVYGEFWPEPGISERYVDYNAEAVSASIQQEKDVIIYFGANWCPTCTRFEKNVMKELSSIPENMIIFAADVDRDTEAKQMYWVRSQSTTVYVWKEWEVLEKRVARDHSIWDIVSVVTGL